MKAVTLYKGRRLFNSDSGPNLHVKQWKGFIWCVCLVWWLKAEERKGKEGKEKGRAWKRVSEDKEKLGVKRQERKGKERKRKKLGRGGDKWCDKWKEGSKERTWGWWNFSWQVSYFAVCFTFCHFWNLKKNFAAKVLTYLTHCVEMHKHRLLFLPWWLLKPLYIIIILLLLSSAHCFFLNRFVCACVLTLWGGWSSHVTQKKKAYMRFTVSAFEEYKILYNIIRRRLCQCYTVRMSSASVWVGNEHCTLYVCLFLPQSRSINLWNWCLAQVGGLDHLQQLSTP